MRPQSAKAKGRRLQQAVRDKLLAAAPELEPDDIRSTSMGAGGEDLLLSPAARKVFPFSIECKNVENLNIWKALEQAEANSKPKKLDDLVLTTYDLKTPLLCFKRNNTEIYAALKLDDLIRLLRK